MINPRDQSVRGTARRVALADCVLARAIGIRVRSTHRCLRATATVPRRIRPALMAQCDRAASLPVTCRRVPDGRRLHGPRLRELAGMLAGAGMCSANSRRAQKKWPLAGPYRKGADACCSHLRFRERPLCDATWLVTKADSFAEYPAGASREQQAPFDKRLTFSEKAQSRALDSDGSLELRYFSAPFRSHGGAINMPIALTIRARVAFPLKSLLEADPSKRVRRVRVALTSRKPG
jgi:hypothetical protein